MSASTTSAQAPLDTVKAIVLQHGRDGAHVILLEMPSTKIDGRRMELHTHDLGLFNELTARSAQERLQFRFAKAGRPLTEPEVFAIQEEIRNRPF